MAIRGLHGPLSHHPVAGVIDMGEREKLDAWSQWLGDQMDAEDEAGRPWVAFVILVSAGLGALTAVYLLAGWLL